VTLDLVNDYLRFVTGFFEVISTSAAHIYHSALPLSPRTSMVRRLYEPYAHPLMRIVQGVPVSWDLVVAATMYSYPIQHAIWSPCSTFIAIGGSKSTTEILDGATLKRVKSLTSQPGNTRLLTFSAGSRSLTRFSPEPGSSVSWDLRTGVPVGVISPELVKRRLHPYEEETIEQFPVSITYSRCETMFGVLFRHPDIAKTANIITYNVLSGASIGHCSVEKLFAKMIWTHGKHIRFATLGSGSITIWEVEFFLEYPATEVKSLPIPNNFDPSRPVLYLPTHSRLAFVKDGVSVWDAQHSKFLLADKWLKGDQMSFSADGHFFACDAHGEELYLWKDSPTGYTFHRKFKFDAKVLGQTLSPDGQSILAFDGLTVQLWRTTDLTPTISAPDLSLHPPADFVLGFSPDVSLAVAARWMHGTATVIDLRSGIPRLTIDAGMGISSVGVGGGTVVAVGHSMIVTWNLPQTDRDLNATANINNSIRATHFNYWPTGTKHVAISSDLSCIALVRRTSTAQRLEIYDMTTGKYLAGVKSAADTAWFNPDRLEVLCCFRGEVKGWALTGGSESNSLEMESLDPAQCQKSGYPWTPPSGYRIAHDGWVFGRSGRRLLWLPPHWRLRKRIRMSLCVWSGRFLALLHCELPEPVILEVLE